VQVNLFATLRQITGRKALELPLDAGATAGGLLEAVVAQYPALRAELLDAEGRLLGHVHLFVNGRDAPYLEQGLATPLSPDDKIDLFPAVGGG